MSERLTTEQDQSAINIIRSFAMDAPLAANSGHQGTAMALAPLAHVLYSRVMKFDPLDTEWPDRDRFILSAGHASILQYSLLYLTGSGLEIDDIKQFRQWDSLTPGHPEAGHTKGVEVTTGPLGQGVANAVGMALAERVLADRFGSDAVDHYTYVIAGDGCLMEGVSHEAASLAGHLGLDKLIMVYDDNHVTIDGDTALSFSDQTAERYRSYGWDVVELGEIAEDLDALETALIAAKSTDKPSLLVLRSHIGFPSPDLTDDPHAHGLAFDAEAVTRTKAVMGIPDEPFWAPGNIVDAYRQLASARGREARTAWVEAASDVLTQPDWLAAWAGGGTDGWDTDLPNYEQGEKVATRKAINAAINATIDHLPGILSGSADLTGNTGVALSGATEQSKDTPGGRQVYYGIREHAMGSAMVGAARHGGILPIGGTFFVFLDYMRPPVRLAALSHAKAVFVFTHDSVGVGEDGPTHQPIEHLATLRAIPDLHVIRPADANETVAAWRDAVLHDGPTALVLSRQNIAVVTDGTAVDRGAAVIRGAADAAITLAASGSEVSLCVAAADLLEQQGVAARVVSMPSWDRFDAQDNQYRRDVFPSGIPVLGVEAGVAMGWHRYADDVVSIERFGASAPADDVFDHLGFTPEAITSRATDLLASR